MPHICVAPHWLDWSPALGPRSALGPNTGAQHSQAGWGAAASLQFDQGDFRTSHPYKYSLLMHCIKIKSPANLLLNEQYVFVGGNISFLCVLSCNSEEACIVNLIMNQMVCKTKWNLKRPDEGGVFWKYLLWLWVWSRLISWYSSTSDSSGMSDLITELIYWTKTSRVSQLISWCIFSIQKKICGYQVMATTSNFKFDSIN